MARFPDLPNEIVLMVWRQVLDPETIENFALTSKNVYALGSSFVKEHNELKSEFSCISVCEDDAYTSAGDALKDLLLNPRAALYVRSIYVDGWRTSWDLYSPYGILEFTPHVDYFDMELFIHAVETSPFVPESEVPSWIEALESGDEGAVLALIIMRLPNVRLFELSSVNRDESYLPDVIRRIANSPDTDTLSRLTRVRLGRGKCMVSGDVDWEDTFFQLPSVEWVQIG